ncbi:MAG: hypothetical protein KJN75_05315 [Muriicola sp.]|nr:hypothetical protein [Muriicola sp.]
MKNLKIVLLLFIGLSFSQYSNAQEIGARFGDALGNESSVAIDAVFAIGKLNRVHADVSFGNGVGIEALYDFVNAPIGGEALSLYAGAGVSLFLGDPFLFGIPGEVGIEYHFNNIPLALGADWRPGFVLVENTDFSARGFGFNVRFVLN